VYAAGLHTTVQEHLDARRSSLNARLYCFKTLLIRGNFWGKTHLRTLVYERLTIKISLHLERTDIRPCPIFTIGTPAIVAVCDISCESYTVVDVLQR
jgi:hypothetical protein